MKAPKKVYFWDALPSTAVGKINKKAIRQQSWDGRERMVN
jgi:non-ribosomal peptide synthetase component E (peptide arylation enzyme)